MSESAKPAPKPASVARQQRLMQVLLAPTVSEKSTMVGDKHNQYVFRVDRAATKGDVKAAIELMWKVSVEGVQVLNVKGKEKRTGRFIGRRNSWKKAYVRLKPGQEINFAEGEGR
ncbi:MAG: 50S ribosomal protein L23 [Burkholderiales bacterium]